MENQPPQTLKPLVVMEWIEIERRRSLPYEKLEHITYPQITINPDTEAQLVVRRISFYNLNRPQFFIQDQTECYADFPELSVPSVEIYLENDCLTLLLDSTLDWEDKCYAMCVPLEQWINISFQRTQFSRKKVDTEHLGQADLRIGYYGQPLKETRAFFEGTPINYDTIYMQSRQAMFLLPLNSIGDCQP